VPSAARLHDSHEPEGAPRMSDGPLTPWAFLLFLLAVTGLAGLVLWRVVEATLLRLYAN
jgi:hypothetical protein